MIDGAEKNGPQLSSSNDSRITSIGKFMRKTRLDELPQFINVLKGEMSIVGPRPEDIDIVDKYYDIEDKQTLQVKPGITSPGSLFFYAQSHIDPKNENAEEQYARELLPIKLALERVYIEKYSILYDIEIVLRTIFTIILINLGKTNFQLPKEYSIAMDKGYINTIK